MAISTGLGLEAPSTDAQRQKNLNWKFNITHSCSRGLAASSLQLSTARSKSHFAGVTKVDDFYEILCDEDIGRGAFGTCFAGQHKTSSRPCIIKSVTLATAPKPYVKACAASTDHCTWDTLLQMANEPNIVRYLDFLFSADFAFVVMEKLSGPELLTYLEEKAPVTEEFCRCSMRQVLTALEYIHTSVQLIHRDVKLENLRFRTTDPESDLVLLDFGLCCFDRNEPDSKRDIVGTLLYMAPEVFTRNYSTQVDQWSAGVVLFIMLTGRPPWHNKPSQGFRLNKEVASGQAVEAALDSCSDALPVAVELLKGLLDMSPDRRFTATASLGHAWFRSPEKLGPEHLLSSANTMKSASDSIIDVAKDSYARTRLESKVSQAQSEHCSIDSSWERCLNLKDSLMSCMQSLGSSCTK
eukprot:gnl/MRDRNA2_/MRDRNA2_21558_c0_seq1.p1 gnl/MRDRNA2_/MRDRNA2_21558_c0~~gnl/MRDRNA2_/MRDRNA2_21558_c0_seq1.p1  ORF type:complete len:478 (+),score=74.19 gnl/MRDRNA2_/MRDRNA2_21558_c0_seq1:202-1434(+)